MRITIERIRTLVLAAGVLLLVALAAFLAIGKWKIPFNRRDIPKRLGIDIQQEANGFTYTQAHAGHTLFKIHASKVVKLKNSIAQLHDVQIDLYGADGISVDRIVGDEFEYDQKGGMATAAGPVEITIMRPGEKPAIASEPLAGQLSGKKERTAPAAKPPSGSGPPAAMPDTDQKKTIHVKTSGLVFNQQSGVATTTNRVDFSSLQGSGSSIGATYDSQKGYLVLDHSVEMTTHTSDDGGPGADPVEIHAAHAEFDRVTQACRLNTVAAKTRGEQANAAAATILFRDDGSVQRLDASGGFTVTTATGGHLAAPNGLMTFDEDNKPHHAHLEGGVMMDSTSGSRVMHGTAPTMELEFTANGELRHAHLERGVEVESNEQGQSQVNGQPVAVAVNRKWRSPVADVEFRPSGRTGKGQVEPANIHGAGGVVMTGESRRGNAAPVPSSLAADELTGVFGPASALTEMTGAGHASMEQTTATGAKQTASGDRLEAHFTSNTGTGMGAVASPKSTPEKTAANSPLGGAEQVQSAVIDGHVVLVQQPAAQAGGQPQPPLRATAGRAEYEGASSAAGEWLHLTINPRVDDGGLRLTADKVDVAQSSGDAFAHGNVKATWTGNGPNTGSRAGAAGGDSLALGGKGPAHAVANEAQLHQAGGAMASGEATFRGHARLWQDANSVAAPVIEINREKQILTANSTDPAEPVRVVMVSAAGPGTAQPTSAQISAGQPPGTGEVRGKSSAPSVIRMHGGDLWYSDAERRTLMHGAALGTVVADTGGVESVSDQVELFLTPAGQPHPSGAPSTPQARVEGQASQPNSAGAPSQVDRMTATGHVVLTSQGRRGTGEQLTYTSRTGDYVLTGTPAASPRMTDPQRGTVTGETLIFHSRDNSVSVEGGAQKTRTDTTAPR